MNTRNPNSARLLAGTLATVVMVVSACSTSPGLVRQKLDPLTSVTISFNRVPMVFYRDDSGRAAYARDYVHLAPLEVNRGGSYRYFLWLGIWNTNQESRSEQSRNGFESVVIYADGEPLPLEISGWTAEAIGASESVYLKPVASATDAYFEVTADQIRVIAEARDLRLQSTGPRRESYEPWDDQISAKASLAEFLNASIY